MAEPELIPTSISSDDPPLAAHAVSVQQAARLLGIGERAVRKRIRAGTLQAQFIGNAWLVWLPEDVGLADIDGSGSEVPKQGGTNGAAEPDLRTHGTDLEPTRQGREGRSALQPLLERIAGLERDLLAERERRAGAEVLNVELRQRAEGAETRSLVLAERAGRLQAELEHLRRRPWWAWWS